MAFPSSFCHSGGGMITPEAITVCSNLFWKLEKSMLLNKVAVCRANFHQRACSPAAWLFEFRCRRHLIKLLILDSPPTPPTLLTFAQETASVTLMDGTNRNHDGKKKKRKKNRIVFVTARRGWVAINCCLKTEETEFMLTDIRRGSINTGWALAHAQTTNTLLASRETRTRRPLSIWY